VFVSVHFNTSNQILIIQVHPLVACISSEKEREKKTQNKKRGE